MCIQGWLLIDTTLNSDELTLGPELAMMEHVLSPVVESDNL